MYNYHLRTFVNEDILNDETILLFFSKKGYIISPLVWRRMCCCQWAHYVTGNCCCEHDKPGSTSFIRNIQMLGIQLTFCWRRTSKYLSGCLVWVSILWVLQRFQRRDRDDGKRDGGRDSGAGADRERQRRERLQQQKRGQWNAYWQDKNAPRVVYNSSVCIFILDSWLLSLVPVMMLCWHF